MAHQHTVAAGKHAPALTALFARFVTSHPIRGWSDAVDAVDAMDAEAHRAFANAP